MRKELIIIATTVLTACSTPSYFDETRLQMDSVLTTDEVGDIVRRQYFTYNDTGAMTSQVTLQITMPGAPMDTDIVEKWEYGRFGVTRYEKRLQDEHELSTYSYKPDGRLAEVEVVTDGASAIRQIFSQYRDGRDSMLTIIQQDENITQRAVMLYDSLGHDAGLTGEISEDGIAWEPDSRIEKRCDTLGRDISSALFLKMDTSWAMISAETHEFDSEGHEVRMTTSAMDDDETVSTFEYDKYGNLIRENNHVKLATGELSLEQITEYTYAKNVKQVTYLDPDGNVMMRETYYFKKKK